MGLDKVKVYINLKMVQSMKGNGKMMKCQEKDIYIYLMVQLKKENLMIKYFMKTQEKKKNKIYQI